MDLLNMSAEEVVTERRRREARRAQGLPLNPTSAEESIASAERIAEEDARQEKAIQAEVRKKYIAFGCVVYNLSQPRATKQTAGLGDLYVINRRCRVAFWHETKTPRGVQSPTQKFFEESCAAALVSVVVGGVLAAEHQLVKIGAAYRDSSGSLEPRRETQQR